MMVDDCEEKQVSSIFYLLLYCAIQPIRCSPFSIGKQLVIDIGCGSGFLFPQTWFSNQLMTLAIGENQEVGDSVA